MITRPRKTRRAVTRKKEKQAATLKIGQAKNVGAGELSAAYQIFHF